MVGCEAYKLPYKPPSKAVRLGLCSSQTSSSWHLRSGWPSFELLFIDFLDLATLLGLGATQKTLHKLVVKLGLMPGTDPKVNSQAVNRHFKSR